MEVFLEENELVFSIQSGLHVYRESIPADLFVKKDFIMTNLYFYAFKNIFSAYVELQDSQIETPVISIPYTGILNGKGIFRFGEMKAKSDEDITEEQHSDVVIFDEFLLRQSRKKLES
jgi:hypothetical protein